MRRQGIVRATLPGAVLLLAAGCAGRGPVLEPGGGAQRPAPVEIEATPFFPQERYECGPAALATVLAASGVAVTADSLVDEVYLPGRRGSLQPELVASARRHGRVPYVLPPSLDALIATLDGGQPVLVLQKLGAGPFPGWHYAVVIGYDAAEDRVVLRSGTTRRKSMSAAHFLATWTRAGRWALLVLSPGVLPPAPDFARYMEGVAGVEAVGRPDVAAPAYAAAAAQWPEAALPRLALGNLAYAAGDFAAAEREFREAVRLDPQDAAARNNRAEALRQMGCLTVARREVERARALAADGPLAGTVRATDVAIAQQRGPDAPGCPAD